MPHYGIVAKIGAVKGNLTVDGYVDHMEVHSIQYAASAIRTESGGKTKSHVSVRQNEVSVIMRAGSYTAEMMQHLLNTFIYPEVLFTQLGQAVDGEKAGKPSVLQTLKLTNAVLVSMSQGWRGDEGKDRSVTLTFEAEMYETNIEGKIAAYKNDNWAK